MCHKDSVKWFYLFGLSWISFMSVPNIVPKNGFYFSPQSLFASKFAPRAYVSIFAVFG